MEWLAFKDAMAEQACAALGAERTGMFGDPLSAPMMGAELASGFYLILVDSSVARDIMVLHMSFVNDPRIESEVLSLMCHDGIMMTSLESWTNGQRNWSVSRMEDAGDVEVDGPVPEPFATIHAKLSLKQEESDRNAESVDHIYDVTAELGKALTGFQHDDEHDPVVRFEILTLAPHSRFRVQPSRSLPGRAQPGTSKPWWKFW